MHWTHTLDPFSLFNNSLQVCGKLTRQVHMVLLFLSFRGVRHRAQKPGDPAFTSATQYGCNWLNKHEMQNFLAEEVLQLGNQQ